MGVFRKTVFLLLAVSGLIRPVLFAEEEKKEDVNFQYQTIKTKEGLTFRVPVDMPIENRGGIQAPIPFDEYMYGKFAQMDRRMEAMDQKLDRIEKFLIPEESKSSSGAANPSVLKSS